jgi:hypothetical protein
MNITEKISRLVPGITITEQGDQVISIPAESFHQIAETLRNDQDEPMDFLRDIVGMDWQEGEHFIIWNQVRLIIVSFLRLQRPIVKILICRQYVTCGKLQKSKNVKYSTSSVSAF